MSESLADLLAIRPRLSDAEIGRRVGMSKHAVLRRRRGMVAVDSPAVAEWEAKRDATERDLSRTAEKYDWARIVELPRLAHVPVTTGASEIVIVYSDTHFGHEDEETLAILYETARQLRPKWMIGNGDLSNLGGMGKYAQNARPTSKVSLREEQRRTKSHWLTLGEIGQSWGMRHTQTNANHDGDSEDSRWERWLSERVGPDFLALEGAEEITYSHYFHHRDVPVEMREEVILPGRLRVRHGRLVRKSGGQSARGHGHDQLLGNILIGHTHRQGYSPKRIPALDGFHGERVMKMWEGGCCCRLASYAPDADWVRGFAIVHVDAANDCNQVELVTVEEGRAIVPSLGQTIRAA